MIRGPKLSHGNASGRKQSLCVSTPSPGGCLANLPVRRYGFTRTSTAQSVRSNLCLITRMVQGDGRTSRIRRRFQSGFLQNPEQQRWSKNGYSLGTQPGGAHQRHGFAVTRASVELAGGMDIINNLGLDSLTFLAATVLVVPAFKAMKASPVHYLPTPACSSSLANCGWMDFLGMVHVYPFCSVLG